MSARLGTAHVFPVPAVSDRNWDSLQFRTIFALVFPVYLVVAVGTRFAPSHWRNALPHRSIFAEASKAAGTTAQIAFAG